MKRDNDTRGDDSKQWLATLWRVVLGVLTHNWHIKLTALFLAVVFWPVLMLSINPMRTRTVENVAIRYDGLDYFNNERKLAIVQSISDLPTTVDVDINVPQEQRSYLNSSTVSAYVDFSGITEEGDSVRVPIDVRTDYGTRVRCDPAYIEVSVEGRYSKHVPVKVREINPMPEGFQAIGQYTVYPRTITIWGAKTVVDQVEFALADIDMETVAGQGLYDYSISPEVVFVDKEDQPVNSGSLSVPDGTSVSVTGRVLPTALKPILFGPGDYEGQPASGYALRLEKENEYDEVSALEDTHVLIAAPQDVLNEIEHITLGEVINIEGKKESYRDSVLLNVPSGVEWMQHSEIDVYAVIYEIMQTRAFDNIDLEVRGLKEGMEAFFEEGLTVRVVVEAGEQYEMDKLNHDDVVAYLDVSDCNTVGMYEVNVSVEIAKLPYYTADPDRKTVLVSISPEGS